MHREADRLTVTDSDRSIERGGSSFGPEEGQELLTEGPTQTPHLSSSFYVLLANTADLTTHSVPTGPVKIFNFDCPVKND